MIDNGFKPVAWVAAVGGAALACYMLSLQVAAERAELAAIERRIVVTQQSIRSLQTELGTRGRLQQLEQWNAEVLALSAPVAHQYLDSNVSLARFDVRQRGFADQAEVRMAAAGNPPAAPARPTVPATQPTVRLAAAPAPAAVPGVPPQPILRRASLVTPPAAARSMLTAAAQQRPPGLLDDSTLLELRTRSRSEGDEGIAD